MKIDPYKHEERYLRWLKNVENGIPGLNKENSEIIMAYLKDMENGLNVASASAKGARSYLRLNALRERLHFLAESFKKYYNINKITDISEEQLITFFSEMRSGKIRRLDGQIYKSIETPAKMFKAFWHWYQKINRKKGIEIQDITCDLDTKDEKPDWVYLTEEQVKKIAENAKYDYKALIYFLFDTGIRSPTELVNVLVSDLHNNCKELTIREEVVKKGSFGRRIKLMICSDLLREYIKSHNFKPEDQLFAIEPKAVNRYLKTLSIRLFGEGKSPAGQKYSELSMYDFRHCSCCYWLLRYKSESALKYRFGWKKSDKIHYYSELLGMKDNISEEDLLIDVTKTEIEKELLKSRNKSELMDERIKTLEMQIAKIMGRTGTLAWEIKDEQ